ncbi:MAG: helix-turn-helix transcriptional regulator [Acidimicrobiia bacterium]|nr:helix-turn-helix transcriptional regulator [Acidimicrobiia bacterium]
MTIRSIGPLLKEWRAQRRMSQLDLATATGISQRHISFVETGRSRPSRELVLHLAESLDVPLRDRNVLLHAAGFAPQYGETPLDDPDMSSVRHAIELMVDRHDPYPAVVLDRHWNLIRANPAALRLTMEWAAPEAIEAAAGNLLRLLMHPAGYRPHILNFEEVASSTAVRLHRELIADPHDAILRDLTREVMDDPSLPVSARAPAAGATPPFVLPIHLQRDDVEVCMFSTLATIGSPLDITVQELVIELFFPADAASETYFRTAAE